MSKHFDPEHIPAKLRHFAHRVRAKLQSVPPEPDVQQQAHRDAIDSLYSRLGTVRSQHLPDRVAYGRRLAELQRGSHVASDAVPDPPPHVEPLDFTEEEEAAIMAFAEEMGTYPEAVRQSLADRRHLRRLKDYYLGRPMVRGEEQITTTQPLKASVQTESTTAPESARTAPATSDQPDADERKERNHGR